MAISVFVPFVAIWLYLIKISQCTLNYSSYYASWLWQEVQLHNTILSKIIASKLTTIALYPFQVFHGIAILIVMIGMQQVGEHLIIIMPVRRGLRR